jgi:hypothetical protein
MLWSAVALPVCRRGGRAGRRVLTPSFSVVTTGRAVFTQGRWPESAALRGVDRSRPGQRVIGRKATAHPGSRPRVRSRRESRPIRGFTRDSMWGPKPEHYR